jgi:hypothetical protein
MLPGPATEAEKVLSKFNSPQEAETIEPLPAAIPGNTLAKEAVEVTEAENWLVE